ncbi:MAG: ATP-binding protein [Anaerolineae bacterium]|nr:ATP-binding protein [Anaerolineae bacterium]
MSRLWVRFTLAFVAVSLLTAGLVAGLTAWNASRQFRGYLVEPVVLLRGGIAQVLEAYYEQNGSWEGVDQLVAFWRERAQRRRFGRALFPRGITLLIADPNGRIVFDERADAVGKFIPPEDISRALPILVNNEVKGYVLASALPPQVLEQPEQRFLSELQRSIFLAAGTSAVAGTLLGVWFSRSLARPLSALSHAAHAFARADWRSRVPAEQISNVAELRDLALAFNHMADSLQRAEVQRRNLMADIAHELRTPLSVMQGLLRAILDGVHPLTLKEVAAVYDETRLLSRLVDDVRTLSLAEAQQLPLTLQPIDARALIHRTVAHFAALADAQGVTLAAATSDQPLLVCADPDRLEQVLRNLVTNAIRHTPAGGRVTLSAVQIEDEVRLTVEDTGEGIAPEDLPFVFDRFYRGDKSRARSSGGAGLGLAIAKSLVEAMKGRIGVETTLGAGSRFWVVLPASK